jgi:23S rRNA pseudouridine1911/1915/1917 synthase
MDADGPELDEDGDEAAADAGGDVAVRAERRIPEDLGGSRLDVALARLWPEHSRSRLQRWIRDGDVHVDGASAAPRTRVLGGERVRIDAVLEADERWVAQPVDFGVLHEDAAVILVDKPAGLVVHPGAGNRDGTLVNGLLHRYPELARVARAGIVHRLDKDTTGILAVARTPQAHTALVAALAERSVHREYLAVVEGVPTAGFTVDAPIGRDARNRLRMAVDGRGREAVTHVRVLLRFRAHALVRARLETGRTHQIRVHLRHRGHALVGDALYGARGRLPEAPGPALVEAVRGFRRQALHARRLALAHPEDGRRLAGEAPVPADLDVLIDALAEDAGLSVAEIDAALDAR